MIDVKYVREGDKIVMSAEGTEQTGSMTLDEAREQHAKIGAALGVDASGKPRTETPAEYRTRVMAAEGKVGPPANAASTPIIAGPVISPRI